MANLGYPREGGNSEAEYILLSADSELPNSVVLTAGSNITLDESVPGQVTISSSSADLSGLPFVTYSSTGSLSAERVLTGGNNITIDLGIAGQAIINAQATGGGAPTTASYITINPEGSLSAERSLAAGSGISITDNGANSTVDVAVHPNLLGYSYLTLGSAALLSAERTFQVTDGLSSSDLGANSTFTLSASGLRNPQYVVLSADAVLPNERVLTAGTGISLTDAGAGGAITVANTASGFNQITVTGQGDVVADALMDIVTFAAGTGISITIDSNTDTITFTNSSPNVVQNLFETIAVSGFGNIVADTATDTLTVVGTDGIYIGTTPGTDTLTISGSGITSNIVQNVFDRIAVSGYPNAVADSATDTFNFSGMDGIVLQLDPTTDTLVISASGVVSGTNTFGTFAAAGWPSIVADSTTDTATFLGTDGIQIGTIPGTDTMVFSASGLNIFKNIAVAGQNTLIADTFTDTLTIAAGTGIQLTTNDSTDTLTITCTVTDTDAQNLYQNIAVSGFGTLTANSPTNTLNISGTNGVLVGTTPGTDTLTISGSGLPQTAFTIFAVSGQSNVVSDGIADTVTLAAGTGMSITTDDSSDTINFINTAPNVDQNLFSAIAVPNWPTITASTPTTVLTASGVDGIYIASIGNTLVISASGVVGSGGNSFGIFAVSGQSNVAADQANDTVTLVGSGIDITTNATTDTITLTNAASTFNKISVATQGDVIADNLYDGLTFIAGTNMTITTDPSNDSITFTAATAGSGAPEDAKYLALEAHGSLTEERVFTPGRGLSGIDGGAGNAYTLNNTASGFNQIKVSGQSDVIATQLLNSLEFIAGSNITLTTSGTSITIASTDTLGNSFTNFATTGFGDVVADSSSDTVTFVGTNGVYVGGTPATDTLTISGSGLPQVAFANYAVSGQNTIVADGIADTFTFVAGTGITLTTDDSTDSLTIVNNSPNVVQNTFTKISASGFPDIDADSSTDTLTVSGTHGIQVGTNGSTDTLYISASGLNIFSNIAVAGQNTVIADAYNDTVTFAVGTGITITTDDSTDTITFATTGLAANSENFVTIGTTSGLSNERALSVAGGLTIQDNGAGSTVVISASGITAASLNAAPISENFITIGNTSGLSNERAIGVAGGLTIQDNGAGSNVVISASGITAASLNAAPISEAFITIGNTSGLSNERSISVAGGLTIQDNGANNSVVVSASGITATSLGAALNSEPFVTIGNTSGLSAERSLTVAGGLTIQDTGTTVVISASGVSGGGGTPTYESKNSNFNAAYDYIYEVDVSAGNVTCTLPSCASNSGKSISVRISAIGGSFALTFATTSSQTINDGSTTGFSSSELHAVWKFTSNGTSWMVGM